MYEIPSCSIEESDFIFMCEDGTKLKKNTLVLPTFTSIIPLTADIFESGPMPTPWKFLTGLPAISSYYWVKTKPRLAGNQIPFGGTRFGFV